MLGNVLLGTAGFLPFLLMLPAMAAPSGHPSPPVAVSIEPITLAEANAMAPLAQQAAPLPSEPLLTEPQPGVPQDPPPAAVQEPAPSPWAGSLELYGFTPLRATTTLKRAANQRDFPRLSGDRIRDRLPAPVARSGEGRGESLPELSLPDQIEIPSFTSRTDVGLASILEHLTDIFYLRGSVEYKRIGFQTDLSYVGLGAQTSRVIDRNRRFFPDLPRPTRTVKVELATTQGIYDFALRYRFGERERAIGSPGAVTLIPYAGVRVVDMGLETDTTFEGPLVQRFRSFSFGDPFVQPLVGLQGQVFVTPRLRLFARGDLGGFGTNGPVDMSGNAQVGVGYAIGNSTHLNLSWRYLYLARDNGETPSTAYVSDSNGIEAGVKFFF